VLLQDVHCNTGIPLGWENGMPWMRNFCSGTNLSKSASPRVEYFRFDKSNSAFNHTLQVSFSSSEGSLFSGGLYFTVLETYTSSLENPIFCKSSFKNFPAAPTKGFPCRSSFLPGASPMKTIPEEGGVISYTVGLQFFLTTTIIYRIGFMHLYLAR
jgi:hypothetical protein